MELTFPPEFLARLERLAVRARRPASGMSWGRGKGTSAGTGVEFVDIREYSEGDDLRAVDWNLYARLDKLLLRVFRQEREHDVHVLLDVSTSMTAPDPEKWRRGLRLAAAIGWVGLARMDRVAIWPIVGASEKKGQAPLFTRPLAAPFPLAGGKRRGPAMLRWLGKLAPEGATDLAAAAEVFARQTPRGVAVVISDLYCAKAKEGLARLIRSGFEVLCVQVVGEHDDAPQAHGRLELIDAETGRVVRGTVGKRTRAEYQRLLAEERASIAQMLASAGGAFAIAPHDRPLEDVLLRDLRRSGVLE